MRTIHLVGHNGLMASIEVSGLADATTSFRALLALPD